MQATLESTNGRSLRVHSLRQALAHPVVADFTVLDFLLMFGLAVGALLAANGLAPAGHVPIWDTVSLSFGWIVVVIGVGDQIKRNRLTGHASRQLAWNLPLSNIFENTAGVALAWAVGDIITVLGRCLGLLFDQVVFGQMLFSTKRAKQRKRLFICCAWVIISALAAITITASILVPLFWLPIVCRPGSVLRLKIATGLIWFWVAASWALQIWKNWKVGVETGKDFSSKLPVLIQLTIVSRIIYEYFHGKTGTLLYCLFSLSLAINTVLWIQCWRYNRLWRARSRTI